MKKLRISPAPRLEGELAVPGDKSISHRSIIFSSLATGRTCITGFLPGEDCLQTLRAFQALGTLIEQVDATTLIVEGTGRKLSPAREAIDCGNSGTTMRLISGVLAGQSFSSKLFGDASLTRRPMKRIIDPLTLMGAKIKADGARGTAPLLIEGAPLKGITYHSPVASAQVKSCVLLAGLFASGTTTLKEPSQSRDHTERLFEHFHLRLRQSAQGLTIRGGSQLHGEDLKVPGDFSSAAFWLAASAAMPGSNVIIRNVGLNPTRTGLLNVLVRMGAQIRESIETSAAEPFGSLHIIGGRLKGTHIGGDEIPNVIDELPILAAMAALAEGPTVIKDAEELRVKESDRIAIMAKNLRAFGVEVEELPDGMVITGGRPLKAARVTSHGDHRIAMACACLALSAPGPSVIEDVECINTSYPTFEQHLKFLTEGSAFTAPRRLWKQITGPLTAHLPQAKPSRNTKFPVIAIDGPAASGKSTVSRQVASQLGYSYLNTGAMYRAVTWHLLEAGIDPQDAKAVTRHVKHLRMTCGFDHGELLMRIEGLDPLPHGRDPRVNLHVSAVAAVPHVRKELLMMQRQLAKFSPLVVEGRDIGSVVFPQTPYKFYLDADPAVRESRRKKQGEVDQVRQRDQQDSTRAQAPLLIPEGALRLDTGKLKLEQVVATILSELKKKGLKPSP
jgi:3-phosphoshikimate 1-carboxyvinyltransferase